MTSQEEIARLTEEFEQLWAKTWETEKGKPPTPEELREHPEYRPVLDAWLVGHGASPGSATS